MKESVLDDHDESAPDALLLPRRVETATDGARSQRTRLGAWALALAGALVLAGATLLWTRASPAVAEAQGACIAVHGLRLTRPGVWAPATSHHTVYLVVGEDGSQISQHEALLSDATDLIALCWRTPCEDTYAGDVDHPGLQFVFMPNSTWTGHRNRLLRLAEERERRLKRAYTYFTFFDGALGVSATPS